MNQVANPNEQDAGFGMPSRSDRESQSRQDQVQPEEKSSDKKSVDFVSKHVSDAFGTPTSASSKS